MARAGSPSSVETPDAQDGAIVRTGTKPALVFFYSPRSGPSRRVEGFLAQVLQRRRNHDTFRLYPVDVGRRPDLLLRFAVDEAPSLAVVEDKVVRATLTRPRGCREIEAFLRPWLQ